MVTEEHAAMLERRLVQLQRELGEYRTRERIYRVLLGAAIVVALVLALASAADAQKGRRVDLGPWNGVIACESRGDAQAVSWAGAKGPFQFLDSTWAGIAPSAKLARTDPRDATLAQNFRQAERLRARYGISQWDCGYRYGDGTGPQWIHGDRPTKAPLRCVDNLVDKWGLKKATARKVCR